MRLGIKLFFQGILSNLSEFLSNFTACYDSSCYVCTFEQNDEKPVRSLLSIDQIYEQGSSVATHDLAFAYGMYYLSSQKQELPNRLERGMFRSTDNL